MRLVDKLVQPLSSEGFSLKTPENVLEVPPCFEEQIPAS
jgi:hypothetical protein